MVVDMVQQKCNSPQVISQSFKWGTSLRLDKLLLYPWFLPKWRTVLSFYLASEMSFFFLNFFP